jgi:hypothetical protein
MPDPQTATPAATPAPNSSPEPTPAAPSAGTGAATGGTTPETAGVKPAPDANQPLALSDPQDKPAETPANWPSNWREIMAGGDQKVLGYLNRYTSPNNVSKALLAFRSKMDAGEIMRSKPEGDPNDPATKQALNEWRAQASIPEGPDGYLEKVPDGLVFGDADKPMLDGFLKDMHDADAPPAFVHKALVWYKQQQEDLLNAQAEADQTYRAQSEDDMRAEWGPEYRGNLNAIKGMLTTHGSEDVANVLWASRGPDGRMLGDNPGMLKFLGSIARELNPYGTVVPSGQGAKAAENEMASIKSKMADQQSEYWRGPREANGQTQLQNRYQQLIEIQERSNARAA